MLAKYDEVCVITVSGQPVHHKQADKHAIFQTSTRQLDGASYQLTNPMGHVTVVHLVAKSLIQIRLKVTLL